MIGTAVAHLFTIAGFCKLPLAKALGVLFATDGCGGPLVKRTVLGENVLAGDGPSAVLAALLVEVVAGETAVAALSWTRGSTTADASRRA